MTAEWPQLLTSWQPCGAPAPPRLGVAAAASPALGLWAAVGGCHRPGAPS
eukprot:COSAG01_NODE_12660_length_1703_cov_0.874065_3_plen_49_part_01